MLKKFTYEYEGKTCVAWGIKKRDVLVMLWDAGIKVTAGEIKKCFKSDGTAVYMPGQKKKMKKRKG